MDGWKSVGLKFSSAGFGAGTPQQEHFGNSQEFEKWSPGWAENFQELKICGHRTVLALTFLGKGVFMDIEVKRMSPTAVEMLDQLSAVCKRFGVDYYAASQNQRDLLDSIALHEYQLKKHTNKGWSVPKCRHFSAWSALTAATICLLKGSTAADNAPPICRIVLYDAAFFMPKKLWQTVPGSEPWSRMRTGRGHQYIFWKSIGLTLLSLHFAECCGQAHRFYAPFSEISSKISAPS